MPTNANGYSLTDTHALGKPEQQQVAYTPDPTSNLVQSVTDALGRQTTYSYDSMGNVTSVTRLAGTSNAVTSSFTYDPTFSGVTSATDPLGHTATFSYDMLSARPEVDPARIYGFGVGGGALTLLHEAVLDDRIKQVTLESMLISLDSVVTHRIHTNIYESVVPGALKA